MNTTNLKDYLLKSLTFFLLTLAISACSRPPVAPPPVDLTPVPYILSGSLKDTTGRSIPGIPIVVETNYLNNQVFTDKRGAYRVKVQHEKSEPILFTLTNAIGDKSYYRAFREELLNNELHFVMDEKGSIRPRAPK